MSENVIQFPEKKWVFRSLTAEDLFPIATLISKIGAADFVKNLSEGGFLEKDEEGSLDVEAIGVKVVAQAVQTILSNLDRCENDIYKILSSTSNLSTKEIKALSMGEFVAMVVDFIKKDDFADFFKQVSSFLG